MSQLLWEVSPWWIALCLAVGLFYAWLLYGSSNRLFSKAVRYTLFALRFVVVSLLCILLLEPFLRQINRRVEEPHYVIAVDNSLSMTATGSSADSLKQTIAQLSESLGNKGQVSVISSQQDDSVNFTGETSDLGTLLTDIRSTYENRNLAGVVLLSDGLYNQGMSPEYLPLTFPIYSLGAGDTTVRRDVILKNLYYNKIAYQGNKYRVQAEILQQGYQQAPVTLQVIHKGNILQQKQLTLSQENPVITEEIILEAQQPSLQQLTFKIIGPSDEFTTENNSRSAYIEIIEGRQKILIAAASPHPDISAIRQAIERNQNYETEVYFPALQTDAQQQPKEDNYDAIIFHGLPSNRVSAGVVDQLLNRTNGSLFIWTPQSNVNALNAIQNVVQVQQRGNETDMVFPLINIGFKQFSLDENTSEVLGAYPPAQVPYGNISIDGKAQILLYQKVGRIDTQKPLLTILSEENKRKAVLLAEGLWKWRITEASEESGRNFAPVLDDLLQKTIQLLATQKQQERFKVYPLEEEVTREQGITFETELYNQLFEKIYGQTINLKITDEAGAAREFTYVNTMGNSRYQINELPAGVYSYVATTQFDNKTLSSQGTFQVIDQQLEMLNLSANHALLRKISQKSGGRFYHLNQQNQLAEDISRLEAKSAILTDEEYKNVLNLEWLLALIILLISLEWFTRKYNGGY
jgi:hypothetical protein